MRCTVAIVVLGGFLACSKGDKGIEEALKQSAKEAKTRDNAAPAQKVIPPVPDSGHVPCDKLIDLAAFSEALGEKDLGMRQITKQDDAEAASSCSLVRGGKPLTKEQQQAKLKKEGVLGVLPGDELCRVTAYCWTIEDPDRFRKKCGSNKIMKEHNDDSMGTHACVQTIQVGENDVDLYRFYDEDTKCILKVAAGASQVDNDKTRTCAKTARDTITPQRIAVTGEAGGEAATAPTGSGSGSGSGG